MFFIDSAYAQEAAKTSAEGAPAWMSFIPFVLMFLVFYLLIIRPQARKAKETQDFLGALKKGDEVLTAGGIFGTIVGVTDRFVDLKVSDNVKLKVLKSHVSGAVQESSATGQQKQKK